MCRSGKAHCAVIPDNRPPDTAHGSLLLENPRRHDQAGIVIEDQPWCPAGLSEDSIGEAAQHGISSGVNDTQSTITQR